MDRELKLTIELVPKTSWYNNMRKIVPPPEWDKIRRRTYAEYGHRCGVCGSKGRLNCHEIWHYDDHRHVQELEGFIALCDLCHHVKHIGLAGVLAARGKLDYESVVKHFMSVNECDRKTFEEHRQEVFERWSQRSQHQWEVSFGEYESFRPEL